MKCPECESEKSAKAGFSWRARKKVQRYRCLDCGRSFVEVK